MQLFFSLNVVYRRNMWLTVKRALQQRKYGNTVHKNAEGSFPYHDQYFSLGLLLMTSLDNLQYTTNDLFRSVHVVHRADADHDDLQINQIP